MKLLIVICFIFGGVYTNGQSSSGINRLPIFVCPKFADQVCNDPTHDFGTTCSSSLDCSNGYTCCPTCYGRPTTCQQTLPTCPAVDQTVDCSLRFPPFECRLDQGCDFGSTCCPTECGGTLCLNLDCPLVTPPSTCPQSLTTLPRPRCSRERDCGSGQGCCPDSCGELFCRPVVTTATTTSSPITTTIDPHGGQNRNCPAVQFPLPEFCSRVRIAFECNPDGDSSDCDRGKTCCRTRDECNTGQCINLSTGNPLCPIKVASPLPEVCARTTVIAECFSDNNCGSFRLCCPASVCGGGQCITTPGLPSSTPPTLPKQPKRPKRPTLKRPTPKRRRRCPRVPRFRKSSSYCARRRTGRYCRRNSDCEGNRRCCRTACGGTACH